MAWLLSRSVLRCQRRRLAGGLRASPLGGAIALAILAVSPLCAWRAGLALGSVLEPVLADPGLSRLLAVAPALAGATAGGALAVTASGRAALGPQLAALPVGARTALVATVLAPAGVAVLLLLPAALVLGVALGRAAPGGALAAIALVACVLPGAAVGAAAAETVVHGALSRGRLAAALGGAVSWVVVGALLGQPAFGPLAPAGPALAGTAGPLPLLVCMIAVTVLGGAAWLELAAHRPERARAARRGTRCVVVGSAATALPLAAIVLLARRRDLRVAVLAAVGFGLAGVALASRVEVPAPGPFHLGSSSTLLGAALAPLVVGGVLVAGRWAWACAPRARAVSCAVLALASLAVLLAALLPVLAAAALASKVTLPAVLEVCIVAFGVAAAATSAGALVPWRGAGVGDQAASFAAFAASAGTVSVAAGAAGPRLVAAGMPAAGAAACLLGSAAAVAGALLVRRLRSEGVR